MQEKGQGGFPASGATINSKESIALNSGTHSGLGRIRLFVARAMIWFGVPTVAFAPSMMVMELGSYYRWGERASYDNALTYATLLSAGILCLVLSKTVAGRVSS